jgi:thiol-disulfide isomerase/thioredoxin
MNHDRRASNKPGTIVLCLALAVANLLPIQPLTAQQKHKGTGKKSGKVVAAKQPAFKLKSESGKVINVGEQKGKIVFLNFWATTCIPCKVEMPTINKLQQHFAIDTNVLILPIDLDNNLPASTGFMHSHGLSLKVYTATGALQQDYFRGLLPTTVVLGKDGKMCMFHEGDSDYSTKAFISFMDSLRTN